MADRIGELAALGTALLWALTYVQFTLAVRRLGASVLNRLRLLAALILLLAAHAALFGLPVPVDASWAQIGWLALSGVIGFAISDTLLFSGLLHLGAHRTSLVMSLIPITSAALSWAVLGEGLTGIEIGAGLITVCGIMLVVSARPGGDPAARKGALGVGVLFALGAVVAQSLRYILSVQGMRGGLAPLSANVLQIGSATIAAWLFAFVRGTAGSSFAGLRDRTALWAMAGGAATGPFLGVTLSMVALLRAPVGIASTLMAMVPVFLLPASRAVFKERITPRAVVGTLLAVAGVALLFLY